MTEEVVSFIPVIGEIQPNVMIKFTLTHDQYIYIKESLQRAYSKRSYIREYMRELTKAKERETNHQPAILFYLYDHEHLSPSIYYEQIRVDQDSDSGYIIVKLSLEQVHYIREVLQRRYDKYLAARDYASKKRPNARKRNTKRPMHILIEVPGQQ